MTARILLVTGSRALVDSPHEAQAQALLCAVLARLPESATVVAGDASGPDTWAFDAALQTHRRVYSLDGWVYDERAARVRRWDHGLEDKRSEKGWPLLRNRQMVRDCAREMGKGAAVSCLALRAEWSRTNGTAHTVTLAREAGIELTEIVFHQQKSRLKTGS